MVNFYVNRIRKGKMTIDEVPERWREAVREAIDPSEFGRTYTETDIPVETEATTETDLTVSDTLEMLSEMGVDTDD